MNALITGGANGLGLEIARKLHSDGFYTIVLDKIPQDRLNKIDLACYNEYHQIDLLDRNGLDELMGSIFSVHGRVDVLINNAALRSQNYFDEFAFEEIEKIVQLNYLIPLRIIHIIYPLMKKNNYGRIITISSIAGFDGYERGSMYCSTKSALNIFTECFAMDILRSNQNITTNVLCPDAFLSRESEKLSSYDFIVQHVLATISRLIHSRRNGLVIPILMPQHRFSVLLHLIKNITVHFLRLQL